MVEHNLAKVGVASSSLVFRSKDKADFLRFFLIATFLFILGPDGGIGRHAGLKILWPLRLCRFDPGSGYQLKARRRSGFFLKKQMYYVYVTSSINKNYTYIGTR